MAKKLVLGKGIASLIQNNPGPVFATEENETTNSDVQLKPAISEVNKTPLTLNIAQIKTNPNQPRKIFKEKDLDELASSIKENGIIQPLIVSADSDGNYELVAGERRLRAAARAGLESVPVVVKQATDREKMIMSIIENVQRADLNCVEEALAYYQLMNDYKLTQEEVAAKLGKERSTIANFLRILKLPRNVIDMLQKELLSFGHAKVLASIQDRDVATRFANIAVSNSLSVRELEKEIKKGERKQTKQADSNPFFNEKLDDCKNQLEKRTGFHFALKSKKNGVGQIVIKFSNEAEFNDVYQYLIGR